MPGGGGGVEVWSGGEWERGRGGQDETEGNVKSIALAVTRGCGSDWEWQVLLGREGQKGMCPLGFWQGGGVRSLSWYNILA